MRPGFVRGEQNQFNATSQPQALSMALIGPAECL